MFSFKSTITGPSFRHEVNHVLPENFWNSQRIVQVVGRGQLFAFQIFLQGSEDFVCALDEHNHISWKGLGKRIRMEVTGSTHTAKALEIGKRFIGYVKGDTGRYIADPLLHVSSMEVNGNQPQGIWICGKTPQQSSAAETGDLDISVNFWLQDRFAPEEKIGNIQIRFELKDFEFNSLRADKFFLDLWQHPCNWARTYEIPLWSEEHWELINHQLELLGEMGQKAITCTVSDYPWIGQECYLVTDYPSNLFEYNIVRPRKSKQGNLSCDFEIFDRWVQTAMDRGITEEIEIYGLMAVWKYNFSTKSFGNPFRDHDDALRIRYFDELGGRYSYLSEKKELTEYIRELVRHLKAKGWWDKTLVCVDEPREADRLSAWMEFLLEIEPGFRFKMMISKPELLTMFDKNVRHWALDLPTLIRAQKLIPAKRAEMGPKGKISWYVSCVPEKPNSTLSSPLLENRILPWLNFYFGMDGFLRWALAIWPNDPWNRPRFVYPGSREWEAGEMFLVYPGKSVRPISSLRLENLRLGIQEHQLLRAVSNLGRKCALQLEEKLKSVLGDKSAMRASGNEVSIPYSLKAESYDEVVSWSLARMEELEGGKSGRSRGRGV
ncbi:MAG: DUF4091 domain-containing protein [Spirochaetales bacterium]|nr:DUF4091 domain-containing protein [Spirochaetales bacterium]